MDGHFHHQSSTSVTSRAPREERKAFVFGGSNRGSADSMQRKKRSREASAKRGTLKTGWYGMGKPFKASMPSTAAIAAKRTVSSKVIGTYEGQLANGRPPTFNG